MTGTLYDAQDNILLSNCTDYDAQDFLRTFNGGYGWEGGRTVWLPDVGDEAIVFGDRGVIVEE